MLHSGSSSCWLLEKALGKARNNGEACAETKAADGGGRAHSTAGVHGGEPSAPVAARCVGVKTLAFSEIVALSIVASLLATGHQRLLV